MGVRLRQALPRRTPQRHHHIAAGCPQRVDLPLDGQRLLVRAPEREHVVPGPPQLAGGRGLHESQRQEPDAVLPSQAVEVWHRILAHVDVGGEKLLLPQIDARRRWRCGRRRCGRRCRRGCGTSGREDETGRRVGAGPGGEADALDLTHRERAIPGGPLDDIVRACATDNLGIPDVVDRAVVVEGELPVGERCLGVVGQRQLPLEPRSPVIDGGVADGEGEPLLELIEGGERRLVAAAAPGLGRGTIGEQSPGQAAAEILEMMARVHGAPGWEGVKDRRGACGLKLPCSVSDSLALRPDGQEIAGAPRESRSAEPGSTGTGRRAAIKPPLDIARIHALFTERSQPVHKGARQQRLLQRQTAPRMSRRRRGSAGRSHPHRGRA